MYTSTLVVAMRDSPSRLSWADQANSREFIPKEALDLEEEYGGFSVNPDFLLGSDAHSYSEANNGHSKEEGSGRGELHTRAIVPSPTATANDACPLVAIAFQQNTSAKSNSIGTVASQPNTLVTQPALPTLAIPHRRLTGNTPSPQLVRTPASATVWPNPHSVTQQIQHSTCPSQLNFYLTKATGPHLHKQHQIASMHAGSVPPSVHAGSVLASVYVGSVLVSVHAATSTESGGEPSHPTSHTSYVFDGNANGSNPMAGKNGGEKAAHPKAMSVIALGPFGDAAVSAFGPISAHIVATQSSDGP
ncbi:hypothetical protein F0562_030777 [Nyssa sinensis]|uniref:Uncharacterized protein n=1 Tax=Nyssa sinensis TaxID=561372 RepID=A0A5J5AZI2_9ASTE|nr:hypothetical protein F0562_030777 [Nyssa sinensis]